MLLHFLARNADIVSGYSNFTLFASTISTFSKAPLLVEKAKLERDEGRIEGQTNENEGNTSEMSFCGTDGRL